MGNFDDRLTSLESLFADLLQRQEQRRDPDYTRLSDAERAELDRLTARLHADPQPVCSAKEDSPEWWSARLQRISDHDLERLEVLVLKAGCT